MRRHAVYIAGLMVVLTSVTAPVFAGGTVVPEIDGGSLSAGLGLLAGSVLMVRARFRRK